MPDDTEYCGGCWVVNYITGACNFHMWALRHNRRFQPRDVANTILRLSVTIAKVVMKQIYNIFVTKQLRNQIRYGIRVL